MSIRPLGDRVLIRRVEEETKSAGGIFIPDSATEKPVEGDVIAVGKGKKTAKGEVIALDVAVGNRVIFGKFSGNEIKHNGEKLLIMREDDILAIVE